MINRVFYTHDRVLARGKLTATVAFFLSYTGTEVFYLVDVDEECGDYPKNFLMAQSEMVPL